MKTKTIPLITTLDGILINSIIISENTDINHDGVKNIIESNKEEFKQLGSLEIKEYLFSSKTERKAIFYYSLNEKQAMLFCFYMEDSPLNIEFKRLLPFSFLKKEEQLKTIIKSKKYLIINKLLESLNEL